jgi:hypothetical protein
MLRITALALLVTICRATTAQDLISAEDFGDAWPFTFEEAYVACHACHAGPVIEKGLTLCR